MYIFTYIIVWKCIFLINFMSEAPPHELGFCRSVQPSHGSSRSSFLWWSIPKHCRFSPSFCAIYPTFFPFCQVTRCSGGQALFNLLQKKSCHSFWERPHWFVHRTLVIPSLSRGLAQQKLENPYPRGGIANLLWERLFCFHLWEEGISRSHLQEWTLFHGTTRIVPEQMRSIVYPWERYP